MDNSRLGDTPKIVIVLLLTVIVGELVYLSTILNKDSAKQDGFRQFPTIAVTTPTIIPYSNKHIVDEATKFINEFNIDTLRSISLYLKLGIAKNASFFVVYEGYVVNIERSQEQKDPSKNPDIRFAMYLAMDKDAKEHELIIGLNDAQLNTTMVTKNGAVISLDDIRVGDRLRVNETVSVLNIESKEQKENSYAIDVL